MKTIEIQIPKGKQAVWINNVLTLVDEKPQDITERIKTFDDALLELGIRTANGDKLAETLFYEWQKTTTHSHSDLGAYLKLRIITAVLNEGWEPKFTQGEKRWYCWFDLITEEEYDRLSDAQKSRVVGCGGHNASASYGLVYADACSASSSSGSNSGSRLAFKNEKLAAYAGRQFAEIYADFCFKPKSEEKKA